MSTNEISHALEAMRLKFTNGAPLQSQMEALVQLMRDREEEAYVRGAEMARRLLRLQLGLSTPEDRK